ncbi:metallophosphoesterase 1 isoform X2 [Bacillus rossius redtenbacheri]|uniref:metallophosphoesterase 1 isoform X2 n=1 Tax=Bacillus rossius redtenbacheri TaxID=93214 RepID=UPI002FDEDBDC
MTSQKDYVGSTQPPPGVKVATIQLDAAFGQPVSSASLAPSTRSRGKVMLAVLASAVLYTEVLSYWLQAWLWWPRLHCEGARCLVLLLVADPQLLGEQYEAPFPKGALTRWDCDRYLSRTFSSAVAHVRPDAVVFLGDLMDEGSIASDEEFGRYLRRFHSVFRVDPGVQLVFVPGDNDVGGEDEPLTLDKLRRFERAFPQPDVIQLQFADVLKVNRLSYSVPKPEQYGVSLVANRTRIVLTHLPLLFLPSAFVQQGTGGVRQRECVPTAQVSAQLRPQLIFSAHDHKSLHAAADAGSGEERVLEVLQPSAGRSPVYRFPLGRAALHEVMVPTCSYRMGVYRMGYGVAAIDADRQMLSYAVLWLPSRFAQLLVYAVLGAALAAAACTAWLRGLCCRCQRGLVVA